MLKLIRSLLEEYRNKKRRVAELKKSPFWNVVFLRQNEWEDSTSRVMQRRAAK